MTMVNSKVFQFETLSQFTAEPNGGCCCYQIRIKADDRFDDFIGQNTWKIHILSSIAAFLELT